MSDTPKQKPQPLEMHKRTITMKDGKREMTFYTFTPSTVTENSLPKPKSNK